VQEQGRWSNRLTQELKVYFPQVLVWFDDVTSPLVGALLGRWVKLEELQKADADELRHFFRAQNCRNKQRTEERIEQVRLAMPAIRDEAIITGAVVEVRAAVKLLAALRESIEEIEGQIAALFAAHPDRAIFASLPAAGAAMAPRLLAAMGSRRERFASAAEVQCFHGIAPVTVRSGRKCVVHFRHACPKFSRQTFHEWARMTIRYSDWARQFFEEQRRRGKSCNAAIRSLAFKWIRILYACWKQGVPYVEARYLAALASRRTPKSPASAPAKPPTPTPSRPVNIQWEPCAGFFKPVGFSS